MVNSLSELVRPIPFLFPTSSASIIFFLGVFSFKQISSKASHSLLHNLMLVLRLFTFTTLLFNFDMFIQLSVKNESNGNYKVRIIKYNYKFHFL